ncbi:hypothetical protein RRF57_000521 [Xylaria bambusicola]|uniref:Uncharacterized protein n=1 Tax=Xylaria bambusicola TaxID=326684 RepID=A0AAN7UD09_9PEZI
MVAGVRSGAGEDTRGGDAQLDKADAVGARPEVDIVRLLARICQVLQKKSSTGLVTLVVTDVDLVVKIW